MRRCIVWTEQAVDSESLEDMYQRSRLGISPQASQSEFARHQRDQDLGHRWASPLKDSTEWWVGAMRLTGLGSLVHLSLSKTRVSDRFMFSLPSLTNLQSLNLSYTQITNQGLCHLRLLKATLESLSLAGLVVTDQGTSGLHMGCERVRWIRDGAHWTAD